MNGALAVFKKPPFHSTLKKSCKKLNCHFFMTVPGKEHIFFSVSLFPLYENEHLITETLLVFM